MGSWDEVQLPAEDLLLLVELRIMFCIGKEHFVLFWKTVQVLCCWEE